MWRRSLAGFLCALLAACGSSSSSSPDPQNPPRLGDVASVRIFDATGVDLTEHLPFPGGTTLRLVIRLYAPDSREILDVGGVDLGFTFTPGSLASSTAVPNQPLSRDVTPTAPEGTPGSLTITIRVPDLGLTRTYGPFDALIH